MTIANELDWCQTHLKDAATLGEDGTIWSRPELLAYYVDGYRDLVAQPQAVRRFTALEIPPRCTATGTQAWEVRYASRGTWWIWTHGASSGSGWAVSSHFELEVIEGYTPTAASEGLSQGWERSFCSPAYVPFRFALPRGHTRIAKIWHNHGLLLPVSVRELDHTSQNWLSLAGQPLAWTLGTGQTESFEVYEVQSSDSDTYSTTGEGMLRYLSGDRTYSADYADEAPTTSGFTYTTAGEAHALTNRRLLAGFGPRLTQEPIRGTHGVHLWEYQLLQSLTGTADTLALGCSPWESRYGAAVMPYAVGAIRAVDSPDRQYVPVVEWADQVPLGKIDRVQSGVNSLLVLEVIEPDVPTLTEADTPGMLPPPLAKYLRYYVLYRALNRQGVGFQPLLASFWLQMFERGKRVFTTLGFLARKDAQKSRQPVRVRSRPGRPRLPSTYPSVWR